MHKIKKGLSLPIAGAPEQRIDDAPSPRRVALLAADYVGMKPTMHVQPGDEVRRGQLLFEDKKTPGVRYTAPAAGRVVAVNRGARRALQSVILELGADERAGRGSAVRFAADASKHPAELEREQIRALLVESGLWTALRCRPFGKVADPADEPAAVFVTAIDTNPLAPDVKVVLAGSEDHFERGLAAVSKLTSGPTFVCVAPGTEVPLPARGDVRLEVYDGPHPAGTVGLHIHQLMPVHRERRVWYLGYQDVVAVGKLFATGELDPTRVIALAGPGVKRPRLLRTRIGAATADLTAGELAEGEQRIVSGSVFAGRTAMGEVLGFLGRYHDQISVLPEGRQREFLGWLRPGADKFSVSRAFVSRLLRHRRFPLTTSTQGSDRAIVPIGLHERVFPMDLLPTFLLKAVVMHDVERAEELGVLELEEEDVALLTFVCPSKHDYGQYLREVLTTIEKEG
ncbi:MAG: Na(+)-translocating NADH-quinone reductase subunit A [Acidobacteria bacterium]|nr:MAG: Na(+)-translocating NADH-quinone reductase subunit A [Acidobacteriota bacterium]